MKMHKKEYFKLIWSSVYWVLENTVEKFQYGDFTDSKNNKFPYLRFK